MGQTTVIVLTERQAVVLGVFARHGGLLNPGNREVRARCKELAKLKLLRPVPFLDGNKPVGGKMTLGVAYQVTATGRETAGVAR